jgi:hypothetical protein
MDAHLTVTTTTSGLVPSTRYMLKPEDPHAIKRHDIVTIDNHRFFIKEFDGIYASINPIGEPSKKFKSGKVEFVKELN